MQPPPLRGAKPVPLICLCEYLALRGFGNCPLRLLWTAVPVIRMTHVLATTEIVRRQSWHGRSVLTLDRPPTFVIASAFDAQHPPTSVGVFLAFRAAVDGAWDLDWLAADGTSGLVSIGDLVKEGRQTGSGILG